MRTDKYIQGFDERLLIAIKKTGLTQREIERRAGLKGKSNMYRYIAEHKMPCAYVIVRLAGVLNVSTDWLLGLRSEP